MEAGIIPAGGWSGVGMGVGGVGEPIKMIVTMTLVYSTLQN